MLHLYDRATMALALTLDLDPRLLDLLRRRFAALVTPDGDLTDWTEYLIVQAGDTEEEIVEAIGLSPLVNPSDGCRYPSPDFQPWWDWLVDTGIYYEMIISVANTGFAYILIIEKLEPCSSDLQRLCYSLTTENE